jgi:hypothetical protein
MTCFNVPNGELGRAGSDLRDQVLSILLRVPYTTPDGQSGRPLRPASGQPSTSQPQPGRPPGSADLASARRVASRWHGPAWLPGRLLAGEIGLDRGNELLGFL